LNVPPFRLLRPKRIEIAMNQATKADVEAACRRIKAAYERGLITTHAKVMAGVHRDLWATEAAAERDIELSGLEQLMRALEASQAATVAE
jgi:hypothetical protein